MELTAENYAEYICRVYKKIHDNKDYITKLDADTGDGDHWVNLDMGFSRLQEISEELSQMTFSEELKKIGMVMMTVIGGSSGILYASGYFEAAAVLEGKERISLTDLAEILEAMLRGIMNRGNAKPGMKTMVDTLNAAAVELRVCVNGNVSENEAIERTVKAAWHGAESTKNMEAVRGRAYYQPNKGVGHLDPGAVTMYYQLEELLRSFTV